jgi:hypothetical protein
MWYNCLSVVKVLLYTWDREVHTIACGLYEAKIPPYCGSVYGCEVKT